MGDGAMPVIMPSQDSAPSPGASSWTRWSPSNRVAGVSPARVSSKRWHPAGQVRASPPLLAGRVWVAVAAVRYVSRALADAPSWCRHEGRRIPMPHACGHVTLRWGAAADLALERAACGEPRSASGCGCGPPRLTIMQPTCRRPGRSGRAAAGRAGACRTEPGRPSSSLIWGYVHGYSAGLPSS